MAASSVPGRSSAFAVLDTLTVTKRVPMRDFFFQLFLEGPQLEKAFGKKPSPQEAVFDRVYLPLEVLQGPHDDDGWFVVEGKVTESMCNGVGFLHGGFIATCVDIFTSMILSQRNPSHPGVSVNMNVDYLEAAFCGETIRIVSSVDKLSKRLAYTTAQLYKVNKNGKHVLFAKGTHTKALSAPRQPNKDAKL